VIGSGTVVSHENGRCVTRSKVNFMSVTLFRLTFRLVKYDDFTCKEQNKTRLTMSCIILRYLAVFQVTFSRLPYTYNRDDNANIWKTTD